MSDLVIHAVFCDSPLAKGAIPWGRSDQYPFVLNSDINSLYWNQDSSVLYIQGSVVINESGASTADVRMEGDTDTALFFLDASADKIGISTSAPDYLLDVDGDLSCTNLLGNTTTQNAGDTLYLGDTTNFNFFFDKNVAGGQIIFGYKTLRLVGATGATVFQVYDNSTNQQLMFSCLSKGSTGGQEEVVVNEAQNDVDFRWESDTNANGLNCDATNSNVTIGADSLSDDYDLALASKGQLALKETTTPTADAGYGKIYTKTTNLLFFQDGDGTEHTLLDTTTGAPIGSSYWVSTADATLTAEVNLGALTTGLLKHTVAVGVSTPATATAGTDYYNPGGTDVALADGGTGVSLTDPNANNLLGWDDTDGAVCFITIGANLTYTHATHTLSATAGGAGTMTTVKEGGVQVGDADIVTLDFDGNDFNLTEDPNTEINIVVNDSGIDHDATTNFVANEHIDWTSTASNLDTSGYVEAGNIRITGSAINHDATVVADLTIENLDQDKDIIFKVNDGGVSTEVARIDGDVSVFSVSGDLKVADAKDIYFSSGAKIERDASGNLKLTPEAGLDVLLVMSTKCRAYLGSAQSINSGAFTLVSLDTESYDIGSDFNNTATNYSFTAPVSGKYDILAMVEWAATESGARFIASIYINGGEVQRCTNQSGATGVITNTISDCYSLSATNTVQLYVWHEASVAKNLTAGVGRTFMSVKLVSVDS